jgi:hypothetical protein
MEQLMIEYEKLKDGLHECGVAVLYSEIKFTEDKEMLKLSEEEILERLKKDNNKSP